MTISDQELTMVLFGVKNFNVETDGKPEDFITKEFEFGGNFVQFQVRVKNQRHSPSMELEGTVYEIDQTVEIWEVFIYVGDHRVILTDQQQEIFEKTIIEKMNVI